MVAGLSATAGEWAIAYAAGPSVGASSSIAKVSSRPEIVNRRRTGWLGATSVIDPLRFSVEVLALMRHAIPEESRNVQPLKSIRWFGPSPSIAARNSPTLWASISPTTMIVEVSRTSITSCRPVIVTPSRNTLTLCKWRDQSSLRSMDGSIGELPSMQQGYLILTMRLAAIVLRQWRQDCEGHHSASPRLSRNSGPFGKLERSARTFRRRGYRYGSPQSRFVRWEYNALDPLQRTHRS